MEVFAFHEFTVNPTAAMMEAGADYAKPHAIDLIVSVGGGSSMDCAKGINFVLSNGGRMRRLPGLRQSHASPCCPMVAVPATAGTGSEAQSFLHRLRSENESRMACGDPKAGFRVAILDPKLTLTQPKKVAAATGYDALSHALESLVTTRHTALSECFSRSAWRLVQSGFERMLEEPDDLDARGALLLGAHFGGLAVENSMLGAAHACASPLTAQYRVPHGAAVALMLPHVVRWNRPVAGSRYDELHPEMEELLRRMAEAAGLPVTLREAGVREEALPRLAEEASAQWPGKFNPRPFDSAGALEIYRWAL